MSDRVHRQKTVGETARLCGEHAFRLAERLTGKQLRPVITDGEFRCHDGHIMLYLRDYAAAFELAAAELGRLTAALEAADGMAMAIENNHLPQYLAQRSEEYRAARR